MEIIAALIIACSNFTSGSDIWFDQNVKLKRACIKRITECAKKAKSNEQKLDCSKEF